MNFSQMKYNNELSFGVLAKITVHYKSHAFQKKLIMIVQYHYQKMENV